MVQLRSPFLVPTYYAFQVTTTHTAQHAVHFSRVSDLNTTMFLFLFFPLQDPSTIYLVMHFMSGGDLHFLLNHRRLQSGKVSETPVPLPEDHVRFYMIEILLALEEMHSVGIVYRDLKPENCLLDEAGHIRLSDFGLAGDLNAEPDGLTVGACGTNGYMSQELLANMPYDFTPDVYAYGVVMYELLHGYVPPPYEDPALLRYRSNLSSDVIVLMTSLLQHDPSHRLGCDPRREDRWTEVKDHSWFDGIDWSLAAQKGLTPPFKPMPDVANCDPMYELEEQLTDTHTQSVAHTLTEEEQAIFKGWDWHTDPQYHTRDSHLTPSSFSSISSSHPREHVELMHGDSRDPPSIGGGGRPSFLERRRPSQSYADNNTTQQTIPSIHDIYTPNEEAAFAAATATAIEIHTHADDHHLVDYSDTDPATMRRVKSDPPLRSSPSLTASHRTLQPSSMSTPLRPNRHARQSSRSIEIEEEDDAGATLGTITIDMDEDVEELG